MVTWGGKNHSLLTLGYSVVTPEESNDKLHYNWITQAPTGAGASVARLAHIYVVGCQLN
jgi:hypothetical protein